MIEVVSGKIGSGKSHDVTRRIIEHLLNGGIVATNMALSKSSIEKIYKCRLSPRQFLRVSENDNPASIPRGDLRGHGSRRVMVVLDEALNWFQSAASSREDTRKSDWSSWLRQSDKLGQHVIFIAQNFERAAKWIRELAQVAREVVSIRDLRVLRVPVGKLLGLSSFYFVRTWDVRSACQLSTDFHKYSRRVWECYDTSELYGFNASDNAYDGIALYPRWRPPRLPVFVGVASIIGGVYVLAA